MIKKIINKIKDYKRGKEALNPMHGRLKMEGNLFAKVIRADGTVKDLGLISKRLVTTAFCENMVDNLIAETSTWGDFKYHASGTDTTAANITDTTMGSESSATRATGTQIESGSVGYLTVGTQSYTESEAITEHGVFNSDSAGTLMDRHTFGAINVTNGMNIEWTYFLTVTAGG